VRRHFGSGLRYRDARSWLGRKGALLLGHYPSQQAFVPANGPQGLRPAAERG
jgi:hypothetical protein